MNVQVYLDRIGVVAEEVSVDAQSLRRLQRSHLLTVPFENLDIHWNRPILLDLERFYSKIVEERRGGFCYELNGLFNELLKEVGFQTRLVSARVSNGTTHGPEFDHAAVIVTMEDDDYLADVGFGDFTAEPLRFVLDLEQADQTGTFVIRRFDDEYLEVAKRVDEAWKSEYIFTDISRDLPEFKDMCDFQQYSPESHFTKGNVCSIMTANGRKTLTDSKYIVTATGEKREVEIRSPEHFIDLLEREFGINPA